MMFSGSHFSLRVARRGRLDYVCKRQLSFSNENVMSMYKWVRGREANCRRHTNERPERKVKNIGFIGGAFICFQI